ncbi:MAG: ABC transporter permease [Hyphomicrobiaceae bacterium]|nr:ABC transporter permease [Hyphomicrobiaceae bacterium]
MPDRKPVESSDPAELRPEARPGARLEARPELRPDLPQAPRRARFDRALVFVALVAIWIGLATVLGTYWVGSPWGVALRLGSGVWGDLWQALAFVLGPTWSDSAVGGMTRPVNLGLQGQLQGQILVHASYTLFEAVAGFLLGAIPAATLPFLLRRLPIATAVIDPFMVGGYGAPKLALAPLFILWFGIGIASKIALVAITVFFIVYFSALAGVRALDARLVQMAQVAGASERSVARHIVFPGAVPYIFTGLRIAMPYSIGGAVIAELISANRGLGYLIQLGAMNFDTTGVFVALVATTCIVFLGNWSVDTLERWLLRWRPPADTKAEVGS